jgi:hypothetical protein
MGNSKMNLLDTFTNEVKQGWQDAKHDLTRDYTQEELNKRHKKVLATMFGSDVANGSVERDPKYRDYGGGVEAEDGGSGYDYVMDYKDYIKLPKADSSNTISSEPSKNSKDLGSFGGATQGQTTTSIVKHIKYPIGATKGKGRTISNEDVHAHIQTAKLHNIIDGKGTADTPYQTQYRNPMYDEYTADINEGALKVADANVVKGTKLNSTDNIDTASDSTSPRQDAAKHKIKQSHQNNKHNTVQQRTNPDIIDDIIKTVVKNHDGSYNQDYVDYVLANKDLVGMLGTTDKGRDFLQELKGNPTTADLAASNFHINPYSTIDPSDINATTDSSIVVPRRMPISELVNHIKTKSSKSNNSNNKPLPLPTFDLKNNLAEIVDSAYRGTTIPSDVLTLKNTPKWLRTQLAKEGLSKVTNSNDRTAIQSYPNPKTEPVKSLPVFNVNTGNVGISSKTKDLDQPEKDVAEYLSEVGENYPQTPKRGEAVLDVEMEYLGDLGHTFGNMTPKEAATMVRNYYVSEKGTKDLINKLKYVVPKSTTDYLETQLKVGNLKPSKKQQDRNEVISALINAEGSYKYGYSEPAIQTAKNYLRTNGSDLLIEQALKNMEYNKKKFSEYEKGDMGIPKDMKRLAIINFD